RQRRFHGARRRAAHSVARLRAWGWRDAGMRHGCRGRRRGRPPLGSARRASGRRAARWHSRSELAWTRLAAVANWTHGSGVRGLHRTMSQLEIGAAVGAPLTETISEDSIADYLKSHPDFFERHGTLVLGLKLPHRAGGATISLVERQVSMLRQRNAQLERQLKDLVAVAKQNDVLVEKIHQLCLKLMRAPTLLQRLERLETGLREDFAAERAVLVLFPAAPAEAVRDGFVRRANPDDADV